MGQNKELDWGISKMWGEMSDVLLFIDYYLLDSDRAIGMHLCDY